MSRPVTEVSGSKPVFGTRATSSNLGWRLFLLAAFALVAAEVSYAEKLGVELLSTTIATAAVADEPELPADEIVVFGFRNEDGTVRPRRLLNDPLLQHILHDFEMRQELEEEFAWRLESADPELERPSVRIGYDPRDEVREPTEKESLDLPMDLIRPAIVISVDF